MRRPPLHADPSLEETDMRLVAAVLSAVFVLAAVSCAPVQHVNLGQDAGYLAAVPPARPARGGACPAP
ncbi:hypothetical protein FZI85_10670 [Mycobacterium sp. CBMA293]|uniref:hypothetical protein n=2 Tax=Mycolicibacterium TaxID=1866885 RepID=UPI0012DC67F1|nr:MULTISPECIES: hypothetical protein [unclassified Mycolicibacterium]MUL46697.1 hypothetical protein [Mycolicibacterium sp. CBMA 360]MUL59002.1 hypothetical protein [Mycolicibacterium sp. CBMA 335]MUL69396.1 hypothetical protein [Mycolicibacterium sp. CBMA 311]MUL94360.1 hypothetical protein [Mycolicibacterium sp. CBMA 230]MUM06624.1 hypothetical protein [Mycolicibacterium sp. CBMA 213]